MNANATVSTSGPGNGERQPPASVMPSPDPHYDLISVLLHWLVAVLAGIQLVLAWYVIFRSQDVQGWETMFLLHVATGLGTLLLVVALLLWRGFHPAPPLPPSIPRWLRFLGQTVNILLYAVLLLSPLTGYLTAEFADHTAYPSLPLPIWGWNDPGLHYLFAEVHQASVWGLAGLIAIHAVVVFAYARYCPGALSRMLPARHKPPTRIVPLREQLAEQQSRRLARQFRFVGWIAFWLQLGLGLIGLLLLMVATSGAHFDVQTAAKAPGVLGAYLGALVLLMTLLAFFYCTRIARGLLHQLDFALSRQRLMKLLGIMSCGGFVGMGAGITGSAASIALLVAKTVTQPPGIAITDPSRIIRALDVFVLLANFDVLVAHFFGTLLALWLMIYSFRHCRPLKAIPQDAPASSKPHPPEHPEPAALEHTPAEPQTTD